MDETAFILCNMAYKIGKDTNKQPYFSQNLLSVSESSIVINLEENVDENSNANASKEYCSVIKKVKKDNITEDNIGEIMLCQIPGISSVTALTIMEKFKYLPNLVKCIQDDPQCLNNICTTDAKGKTRKISKTAIATIVKYLGNKN
jgi:hypothetical protein